MMNSSRITIPKGFRFHPSDEELLSHYLEKKNHGMDSEISGIIPEIDVCKHDPRDLPALVFTRAEFLDKEWFRMADSSDMQWYFFSPRGYKYSNSPRTNRTTQQGSWKIQGKDRGIKARGSKAEIGRKRTLTFYQRGEPKAKKTNWVIHEYYLTQANSDPPKQIGEFVLCRLRNKSDESDHDIKDSPLCNGGEPGSGSCSMASNVENKAAAKGFITEAEEDLAFKELENFLLVSGGNDDDEAEPGSGSYHIFASDFENQAASNGMITEAEENRAFKELEAALQIPNGNEDAFNGLQTAGSCLIGNDKNELPNCGEGQTDSCNPSDFYMIEELLKEPENPDPLFHQLQPPTSTKMGHVSQTTNVHNDECRKRTYPFGDSDPSLTKKKYISTNDDDELVWNIASYSENQAPYGNPEGYPQSGANLGLVFDSFIEVVHGSVKDNSALAIGAPSNVNETP